jgi:hypothetical protein
MKAMLNTEAKKKEDAVEMVKLTGGKKTLGSIFKSKSQVESKILNL